MVDLRDVTFIDCAGVRALLEAHATWEGRGGQFGCRISAGSQVHRLLELIGITDGQWVEVDCAVPRSPCVAYSVASGL